MSRRRPLGRERGLQRTGRRPLLPGDLPPTPCLHLHQGAAQDDACSAPQGERLGQEERGQCRLLRRRRSPTSLSRLPQWFSSSKVQVRTPSFGPQSRDFFFFLHSVIWHFCILSFLTLLAFCFQFPRLCR